MRHACLETKFTSLIGLAGKSEGIFRELGWRAPGARKRVTPPITQQRSERSARTSTDFAVPSKGSARRLGPAASTSRCVGPGGDQSFPQSLRETRGLTPHTPVGLATQHLSKLEQENDMHSRSPFPTRDEAVAMALVTFLLAALIWGTTWVSMIAEVLA